MAPTHNRPPVTAGMLNADSSRRCLESGLKNKKKVKSGPLKFEFNIKKTKDGLLHRLPSLSQCLGNAILPRNSQLINQLYSVASNNAGQ